MSRTLTGWNFWGTPGSPRTEAPRGNQRLAKTRSSAEPLRVRAEVPSVTRKRACLNHARVQLPSRRKLLLEKDFNRWVHDSSGKGQGAFGVEVAAESLEMGR